MLVVISLTGAYAADKGAPPKVSAATAILMDAATGTVLYEKASHARRPPASTTKMMTAIIALERGNLNDVVTASVYASKTPYGNLHVKPGEKFTLRDLLYALMMRSANDAAVCIAEHVAGSEKEFVALMNEKAKEIGAKDTHFVNPHGLHAKGHYSSAYDLALIARYATSIPEFNEIVATKHKRIDRSISKLDVTLRNTGRLLWRFDGADGIKTGYTKEAGHCFVGAATRNGWRLVSVVLKSGNTMDDTIALLDHGFKNYKLVCFARKGQVAAKLPVRGGVEPSVDLIAVDNLGKIVRIDARVETKFEVDNRRATAPIEEGEKLCTLTGYINGDKLGEVALVAAAGVDRTFMFGLWIWTRNLLVILLLGLAVFLAYGTAVAKVARRRRRSVTARG